MFIKGADFGMLLEVGLQEIARGNNCFGIFVLYIKSKIIEYCCGG